MNRLYSAIYVGSRWKIQDRRQIKNDRSTQTKHNPGKANNAKHSTTKLLWGLVAIYGTRPENKWLILQCFWAHMGPLYTVQNRVLLCAENDRLNRQTNTRPSDGKCSVTKALPAETEQMKMMTAVDVVKWLQRQAEWLLVGSVVQRRANMKPWTTRCIIF